MTPILKKPLTYLKCWLGLIVLPHKLKPASLVMLRRSRLLSHITRVCTTLKFSSALTSLVQPGPPPPSTISLPLKSCCLFFHCAIKRRFLLKGVHKVFRNFLGRHSFLSEVLDNRSDFKFLHFANVSQLPLLKVFYISSQA